MEIEYDVVVQPAARDDIREIGDYLVAEAGIAVAERTLGTIAARIVRLRTSPYRSQAVDFIEPNYRRFVEGPYAVYFVIEDRTVSVDRILHTRRDTTGMLAP